ncbi:Uu.00g036970.m01.CDS01 [Anthostomella pinea]|uniref:Uu.00g036970.m01.CDS01 n=1 Tax=Anthostomella pinea TaxID=933095 RepID=A0AAI8V9E4_9PEZI|nr:Uu.00g036970.m01.CDS01 [Anthostomella pinea]
MAGIGQQSEAGNMPSSRLGSRRGTPALSGIEGLFGTDEASSSRMTTRRNTPAMSGLERVYNEDPKAASRVVSRRGTPAMSGLGELFDTEEASSESDTSDDEQGGAALKHWANSFHITPVPEPDDVRAEATAAKDKDPGKEIRNAPTARRNQGVMAWRILPGSQDVIDWIMGRGLKPAREPPAPERQERVSPARETQQLVGEDYVDIGDIQDICLACTTPYCQGVESLPFKSSLNLSYNDCEAHTWYIGDKYIMAERADDQPEDRSVPLADATQLLKGQARVPVPNVIAGWKEHGKVITISERVPGKTLYDIWWQLSEKERGDIAQEVAGYVDLWRGLTSDKFSSMNGGAVWNHDNLFGTGREGFGPFRGDYDFWRAIDGRLRQKAVDDDTIQVLKDYVPGSKPYVLTHGDLSCRNILIHKGKVSAITGFDNAAYLSIWAENVAVHFCYCKEDEQWKSLLSKHMQGYQAALDWWSLWTAVEDMEPDPARIDMLRGRCQRWKKTEIIKGPYLPESTDDEDDDDALPRHRRPEDTASKLEMTLPPRRGAFRVVSDEAAHIKASDQRYRKAIEESLMQDEEYQKLRDEGRSTERVFASDDEEENEEHEKERKDRLQRARELEASRLGRKPAPLNNLPDRRRAGARAREDSSDGDSEGRTELPRLGLRRGRHRHPLAGPPETFPMQTKGLRPLSLPSYSLSESIKEKLSRADDGDAATREETLARTLRSLSSIQEGAAGTEEDSNPPRDISVAAASSRNDRKRQSMFKGKNAPGSFYAALRAAAESKRPPRRRRSEERTPVEESGELGGAARPRPWSMLPPVQGAGLGEQAEVPFGRAQKTGVPDGMGQKESSEQLKESGSTRPDGAA